MLNNLVLGDDMLSLSIDGGMAAQFDYFWLRDNARDPQSYDSRSHQRELFTAAVDPMIRPKAARLSDDGAALILNWPDLEIEAHYQADFLKDFSSAEDGMRLPAAAPWDGESLDPQAVRLAYQELAGPDGVAPLMQRLLAHGFAVLTDCPRSLDAVQQVADSIGYVRQTIFGGLFEFEANEDGIPPIRRRNCARIPMVPTATMRRVFNCCSASTTTPKAVNQSWSTVRALPPNCAAPNHADLTRIGDRPRVTGSAVPGPILRLDEAGAWLRSASTITTATRCGLPMMTCARYMPGSALDGWRTTRRWWRYTLQPGDMLVLTTVSCMDAAFRGQRKMAGAYINRDYESRVLAAASPEALSHQIGPYLVGPVSCQPVACQVRAGRRPRPRPPALHQPWAVKAERDVGAAGPDNP